MFANFLAGISCRLIGWSMKLRGTRIVMTRPWSGGTQITFDGTFDGVVFQRVHDHRKFVFFVRAKPKSLGSKLFQWETPATRPQMIDFQDLTWDARISAWTYRT